MIYCTVEVGMSALLVPNWLGTLCYFVLSASMPKEPILYQWRTKWPLFEFVVEKQTGETIGIEYRAVS